MAVAIGFPVTSEACDYIIDPLRVSRWIEIYPDNVWTANRSGQN